MSNGFCYAILFSSGVLKVGRTSDIYGRLKSHVDAAKAIGGGVSKIFFSYQIDDFKERESDLISEAARLGSGFSGREYFSGLKIGEVRVLMGKVFGAYVECDSISKGHQPGSLTVCVNPYILSASSKGARPKKDLRLRIIGVIERLGASSCAVIANRVKGTQKTMVEQELEAMVVDEIIACDTISHAQNKTSCKKYFVLSRD